MQVRKHQAWSDALGRDFHADVFVLGADPAVLILHFGGSGVSERVYSERSETVVPLFDNALIALEKEGLSFVFAFVTAPFDLGYAHFYREKAAAARWTRHVLEDLLALGPHLPFFLQGYSGGIELVIRGPHALPGCLGIGGLGADVVDADIETVPALDQDRPMVLMCNPADDVCLGNEEVLDELRDNDLAQLRRTPGGGHPIVDYVRNGAFSALVKHGAGLANPT